MPGCSCVLGALAVSQWHVTAASPLVKNVCFHSSCVQLPNNVPRAFSADLKCIRPFLFPSVKRHGRLGRSSSRPGRRRMTRSDLGDYCYTRQKKCYMFVKSCLSSMSFCVGYRSAPGQDTGVDGCTTNRLCIASKPPSEHDGMSSLGGCPSRLRSLTRMWMYPSVGPALSPIKKWAASLNGDSLVNKKWITVV